VLVKASVPLKVPSAVGLKTTSVWQLAPTASVPPQEVKLDANSLAPATAGAALQASTPLPALVATTWRVAVVLVATLPKFTAELDNSKAAEPAG